MKPRVLWRMAAVALTALGFAGGAAAAAQEPYPSDATRTLCLNGAPRPACATFLIVEVQGVLPVLRSTRSVRWFAGHQAEVSPFGDRLQWELGLMHNVSDRWALGGAVRLGEGSTGVLTGLTVRARRWLSADLGLDLSAGAAFVAPSSPGDDGRITGFLADARLNFADDVYAGLRYERADVAPFDGPDGFYDPGGSPDALSLLLGLGSEWAIGGSAALGLALVILLASTDWS